MPCNVVAKIKLADGSSLTKTSYIPEQGTTAYNMPSEGTILWQATDLTSTLIGEKTSLTTGSVTIDLGKPKTDNFVQCVLPNGSATPCTATLNQSYPFSLTQEGGKITTGINDDDGQLEWSAISPYIYESNQWVRYKGDLVTALVGDAKIVLSERELIDTNNIVSLNVVCTTTTSGTPTVVPDGNWELEPSLIGKPCSIKFETMNKDNQYVSMSFEVTYGKPMKIAIPKELFDGPEHGDFSRTVSAEMIINGVEQSGSTWIDTLSLPNPDEIIPIYIYQSSVQ